jgi:NADPH:quinone reductase-like Zn-dependent oxidoreductase
MASDNMRAARVHAFGPPEVVVIDRVPVPVPAEGQVLVRVHAAGAGPWDAWIRAGKSVLPQPLPLTLGSDLAGTVEAIGPGVANLAVGDEIYGVTNGQFVGAWADFAVAEATRLAKKPRTVDHLRAAGIPIVAVTAWQMLFEHAGVVRGQRVLINGAAGNVGAYAVQLAARAGAHVVAICGAAELEIVRGLGAEMAFDHRGSAHFEDAVASGGELDVVIDLVGGAAQDRALGLLKPQGVLISAVSKPDQERAAARGIRAEFILVDVRAEILAEIARLIDEGGLRPGDVGEILPLDEAVRVQRMLDGAEPHRRGKIILAVAE